MSPWRLFVQALVDFWHDQERERGDDWGGVDRWVTRSRDGGNDG